MNEEKLIPPNSEFIFKVDSENINLRLDTFLSKQFSAYSRSFFQKLIEENLVKVNDKIINKTSYSVKENDEIVVKFPPEKKKTNIKPFLENLDIQIVFEHSDFLIINKPAGLLVHAADSKDVEVTLVDWLLQKFKEISEIGSPERPGIVHRLDMSTSGLIIIPRNNYAHMKFSDMFKNRKIRKTYLAIVEGQPEDSGYIDCYIVRHPSGSKMACINNSLKLPYSRGDIREAETKYKVIERFKDAVLVEVNPITGRTHQIRVHFASIGHPLIGDILYGKKSKLINRQALHAHKLEFEYEGQKYNFQAPLPQDMINLIEQLR